MEYFDAHGFFPELRIAQKPTCCNLRFFILSSKDEFTAIRLDPLLPEEEIEQFHDFIVNWDYKTAGLFIDYNSVIGFVMIVENLFRDKYQIEYQWIGGANPYEAYMKSQDEDPIGTIY